MALFFEKSLVYSQIQRITQPHAQCVILRVYHPQASGSWLLSTHPRYPRIHPTFQKLKNPASPPIFCLWLRRTILNGRIQSIQHPHPQCVELEIVTKEQISYLVWESNQKYSNLLLLDQDKQLLMALNNPKLAERDLTLGKVYCFPGYWHTPAAVLLDASETFQQSEEHNPQEVDQYFAELENQELLLAGRKRYQKYLKSTKKRLNRRLDKQQEDLENCERSETYQQWGELLKSQLHAIQPGDSKIEIPNYFEESCPNITVTLDPKKTPQENMQQFFKKASKLQNAKQPIEDRILQTLEEIERLEQYIQTLPAAESLNALKQWENRLPKRYRQQWMPENIASSSESTDATPWIERRSSDGLTILVGRSKEQNAELSFKVARGNDWWFHAQGVSGSHVIVRYPKTPLPQRTLLEAALLAAYYSKARPQKKVDVDYTQRKYIRKVKGGQPGQVLISQNQTIHVELNPQQLKAVLDSAPS